MIAIIDYGMGNLRSVQKALESVGAQTQITQNADDILKADKVVLPGVGAIGPAVSKLKNLNLIDAIEQTIGDSKPFLGICLGLQLLFEESDEGGSVKGLGILRGSVQRFTSLKVPHMGWNQLKLKNSNCPLFEGIDDLENTYFCHSYYVQPSEQDVITSLTEYGLEFTSSINKDNIYGVQFHPEKSQTIGLNILNNFVNKIE